jgi:hypothetical protein
MEIINILNNIDLGQISLPEFQRGYVWNRDQVRGLMQSLYQRHPVGGLLIWVTKQDNFKHRGEGELAPGVVKLLLDGQQRITSLYGIIRGKPPKFFSPQEKVGVFTGLYFHLETEKFMFYSPIKMKDDPLWIDVTKLMKEGLEPYIVKFGELPDHKDMLAGRIGRLNRLLGIKDISLHIEEVIGDKMTIDVVVNIFNQVNSGGTKLSQGDLALAKICAVFPNAREKMELAIEKWKKAGYNFSFDWLLRNVNTIVTGEAKFNVMHKISAESFEKGLNRAEKSIDYMLSLISSRLGLDHDRVFFGRYAMPVMSHYIDRKGGSLNEANDRNLLLFWYLQNAMWGRYSGSTESVIDKDLKIIENLEGGLERLIQEIRIWRGDFHIESEHFSGWSLGARFYPVLYLLTRNAGTLDWGTGLELRRDLLGQMSQLEVHHIFPKAFLYKLDHERPEVNAIANFCFLTKETNLWISDREPEDYFPEIEEKYKGALSSQWIPMDPELWKGENYLDFLEARKKLLAQSVNSLMEKLFSGFDKEDKLPELHSNIDLSAISEEATGDEEDTILHECKQWVLHQGFSTGVYLYELADEETGEQLAILDLAWPNGLQEGFSEPVAILLNIGKESIEIINSHGFRCFTSVESFQRYVKQISIE